MEAAGGWSSDTIAKTAILLSIMELGWGATNQSPLWLGIAAETIWPLHSTSALGGGAVQIVKETLAAIPARCESADHDQKREFIFGWLTWLGAEIIAVAAAGSI